MALTDITIRNAKPRDKPYKLADEKGLYLLVQPTGGKLWRLKYRVLGLEKKLGLGRYPDVSLSDVRAKRDAARKVVAIGHDPAADKQREKASAKENAATTFELVAKEYIANKMQREGKADATLKKARWFLELLTPALGGRPLADITPQDLLAPLKQLENKGNLETAKKCRSFASRVFRYGAATARCASDPAALLLGALISPRATNLAAIIEPRAFGELLRAIDGYTGNFVTLAALQIAPHVFVRPGELRHAEWAEFDLDAAIWRIPAGKMKARRPHAVPLSRQVISYLDALGAVTGRTGYVFASLRTRARPMSENTLNAAFRRMGYTGEELTAHGLRSTASTLLNESGRWNPDAIERALAHGHSDAIRGVYHRGQHWEERVIMAQWWSDHLDVLRRGGDVIRMPMTSQS